MHRFYAPRFSESDRVELPADEAQHAMRVLRLGAGDAVAVFDGQGRESEARIESIGPRRVTVRVGAQRRPAPEPHVAVTLAQALLKSDKMDRVIRDAVMLGVSAVQPFISRRTDVPRAAVESGARHDRWARTVMSSVKQCGRAVVPVVHRTREFGDVLRSPGAQKRVMFVEPNVNHGVIELSGLEGQRPSEALILIGPEGGWDAQEVADAADEGLVLATLGSRILRADAAGAAAIAVLRYIWRDL